MSEQRDRITKLWRELVNRDGREAARDTLNVFMGSKSPNQLRDEDLDRAERCLKVVLNPARESKVDTTKESSAPGLAKAIMAKFNSPAKQRNVISDSINIIDPGGKITSLENPTMEKPRDSADVEAERQAVEASLPRDAKRMAGIDTAEIWRKFNHPPKRK